MVNIVTGLWYILSWNTVRVTFHPWTRKVGQASQMWAQWEMNGGLGEKRERSFRQREARVRSLTKREEKGSLILESESNLVV